MMQNIILGGELDSIPRAAFHEDKELDNKVRTLQVLSLSQRMDAPKGAYCPL